MSRVLVLFSTVDGQTARIAERVAETLRDEGQEVTLRSCQAEDAVAQLRSSDAVVLGSAVRYGDHVPPARKFAKANQPDLCARPGAFFSVCLSADGPGKKADEAQRYVDKFLARSGWTPQFVASFGGALRYPRYNPFIRFLMRLIVGHAGGETDTTREYEYTDWSAVERFTRAFSRSLPSVVDTRPRLKSHA